MPRRFKIPLSLIAVVLLALVTAMAWAIWNRQALASESRELAVSIIQATLSSGSATRLVELAHPDLLDTMSANTIGAYIDSVPTHLGPLQAINSITGGIDVPLVPFSGRAGVADYQLSLSFSQSEATVFVSMARLRGDWLVTDFRVDAPLLYN